MDFGIAEYSSGKLLAPHASEYDLLFLDVKMDDQDGFKTAEILRNNGFSGCLVFSTIMKDDMYRAFEYEAFDYLIKPFSKAAFEHTMERFIRTLETNEKQLVITRKGQRSIIKTPDILYCEVIDRQIILHLTDGKTIEYYGKISELEKELDGNFFRCHRSYLVNLRYINNCNSDEITVSGNQRIPLSRSRKSALMDILISEVK